MIVRKRLPTKWYLTIASLQKDEVIVVKALTPENAVRKGRAELGSDDHKYIIHVDSEPRAPLRNRTGISTLRKLRSEPLNQKGKKNARK